jgi:hypothetical protein
MPKNQYPESLGLGECNGLYEVISKLGDFYEMEFNDFDDLIMEILRHRYGLKKSGDEMDDSKELLKVLIKDFVPNLTERHFYSIKEYARDVEIKEKLDNRQASIIAMFKIYESEGKSQNQIAKILANKGMSKGLKVRYHEALRNPEAIVLSCILDLKQKGKNFAKYFEGRKDISNLKGDEFSKELARTVEPNVDFLIDNYNNHK